MSALDEMQSFVEESGRDSNTIIFGDWNCPNLKCTYNKDGAYEPQIEGPKSNNHSQDEYENHKEGKAAERATTYKVISIADKLELDEIVKLPTFHKP